MTLGELHVNTHARMPTEPRQLSDDLQNGYNTLSQFKSERELDSRSFLQQVVTCLPGYMQNKWRIKAVECREEKGSYPGIKKLIKFVASQAEIANDPMWGEKKLGTKPCSKYTDSHAGKKTVHNNQALQVSGREKKKWPCKVCKEDHKLWDCIQFKAKTPRERLAFAEQKKLCTTACMTTTQQQSAGVVPAAGSQVVGENTKFLHVDNELPWNTTPVLNTSQQGVISHTDSG